MRLFRLHKKIPAAIVSFFLLFAGGFSWAEPIGGVIESTGVTSVKREQDRILTDVGTDINMYDEAETANGRMLIQFLDNEKLSLTENSLVYIDEAYYDPDPSLSKMSIRMARGTARFASGGGSRIKKQNVDVSTPTANITMRGTDFTTTIDELGRTMVILLPDEDTGESSGEILVYNDGGEVVLNQPYQATTVASFDSSPTTAVTVQGITPSLIDNMFIVNPPSEIRNAMEESYQDENYDDQGLLDVDFLEFNELEGDALADTTEDLSFSELDIDYLDVDFLQDLLDVIEELERTTVSLGSKSSSGTELAGFALKGASQGFNKDSQFNVFEQDGDLVFFRDVQGVINIIITSGGSGIIDAEVPGYSGVMTFGDGDGITIVIRQD
jgi:hypothetical protein|tara:strand:- start:971 stop:2122 length:1152 start_codon:yes stop_codon:yes gene_type:complete